MTAPFIPIVMGSILLLAGLGHWRANSWGFCKDQFSWVFSLGWIGMSLLINGLALLWWSNYPLNYALNTNTVPDQMAQLATGWILLPVVGLLFSIVLQRIAVSLANKTSWRVSDGLRSVEKNLVLGVYILVILTLILGNVLLARLYLV